jgi:hydrogenase maturation factor
VTAADLVPVVCKSTHCITCSDEAVQMQVKAVDEARELALCTDAGGESSSVEIALVAPVAPGDTLLVHAGTAISRLEEVPA